MAQGDDIQISQITDAAGLIDLPKGLSYFDHFLRHEIKEEIEAGGEVFVSKDRGGAVNGLFIYDGYEATGTIFTRSREVFDRFYPLRPSSYIFSELDVEGLEKETWNIWELDVDKASLDYRFRHEVRMEGDVEELKRFISQAQPETNLKWIPAALRNGDKCFVVRIGGRIVGIAWMSIVGGMARSHGIYVEPHFRRQGITRDNLQARLIYLKARHVHTLVNEIAEDNAPSAGHAAKIGERIVGKIYLYTSPEAEDSDEFE